MMVQLQILPEKLDDLPYIHQLALHKCNKDEHDYPFFRILKRSIDARKKPVKYNLKVELASSPFTPKPFEFKKNNVVDAPTIHIIGAGPAGLYAALQAIEYGLKPVIYEQGKDVRARRRDLANLNKTGEVNPTSNYCFGEGGAGTYSDGKLYTRSKKRGNVLKAMEWLVYFGANQDILVDAHPHIGTNKLPQLIIAIRNLILSCGGEIHFEHKLTDLFIIDNNVTGIEINNRQKILCDNLILATGHSARDIFYLLHKRMVKIEAKGFALGVRIEHSQQLIDAIQYHGIKNNIYLPPASYSLVTQANGKGVYSFCMCPGGIVAPSATNQDEVVTNGWSPSKRNNPYANSGIVVSLSPEELPNYTPNDPFVCLKFQQKIEQDCWKSAGDKQAVPTQRMIDFVEGKKSINLPKSSYQPGVVSVDLNEVLPALITLPLKKAFVTFGRKMKGFYTNEAILHAPESRTSSPISIPRDKNTLEHINIKGLYPCGEGAGYAGGIISAAVDGMNCVGMIYKKLKE